MVLHIGIVACSAEGAALCYRTICSEAPAFLGPHAHPEITMHTPSFSAYVQHLERSNWDGVADLMVASANLLARAGADFVICPDNTIHQAYPEATSRTKVPWLHIADEVAKVAIAKRYRKVGLLGTQYLMEGPVYPEKLQVARIEWKVPEPEQRKRVGEIILNELVPGNFTDEARNYFCQIIEQFKADGCDAVILGCTEIPLLISPEVSPLPVLDSTRTLARAALAKAVQTPSRNAGVS